MNAKELAKIVERASDIREASWQEIPNRIGKHAKDWEECLVEAECPQDWKHPAFLLLVIGFADTWSWCQEVQQCQH